MPRRRHQFHEPGVQRSCPTANGLARMAPVTFAKSASPAVALRCAGGVIEHLNVSLLGMSFLSPLQGYEMRDGKLTITW